MYISTLAYICLAFVYTPSLVSMSATIHLPLTIIMPKAISRVNWTIIYECYIIIIVILLLL